MIACYFPKIAHLSHFLYRLYLRPSRATNRGDSVELVVATLVFLHVLAKSLRFYQVQNEGGAAGWWLVMLVLELYGFAKDCVSNARITS